MPRPTSNATRLLWRLAPAFCLLLLSLMLLSEEESPPAPHDDGGSAKLAYPAEPTPWNSLPSRLTFWMRLPTGLFEGLAGDDSGGTIPQEAKGIFGWLMTARAGNGLLRGVGKPSPLNFTERGEGDGALRFLYRWDGEGNVRHVAVLPRLAREARQIRGREGVGLESDQDAEVVVQAADPTGRSRFFKFSGLFGLEKPVGGWNHIQVVSRGDRIDVEVNDKRFRLDECICNTAKIEVATEVEGIRLGHASARVILVFGTEGMKSVSDGGMLMPDGGRGEGVYQLRVPTPSEDDSPGASRPAVAP